jgi:hypothetical protein
MNSGTSIVMDLLANCATQGIRLLPTAEGGLTIDAPQDALTPTLTARLKAHKVELLRFMNAKPDVAAAIPALPTTDAAGPTTAVCRCGSMIWRDVPIHRGQTIRRDCGRCGRFIDFPIWYGKDTGQ